jgi:hypothetical protein
MNSSTYWIIEELEVQIDSPNTWDVIANANVLTMKGEAIKCCLCSLSIFTCAVLNETPVLWTAIFQSNLLKPNSNILDSQKTHMHVHTYTCACANKGRYHMLYAMKSIFVVTANFTSLTSILENILKTKSYTHLNIIWK